MNFIYAGENERPVRAWNFRPTKFGGLGLVEASVKARALLLRNLIKMSESKDDARQMY